MIHNHGTPITPRSELTACLSGRHACVSYADPRDIEVVHRICQTVMLDNGAYSFWREAQTLHGIDMRSVEADWMEWRGYYEWVEPWLDYPTTWCVIPDVIDGDEEANDKLLVKWFQTRLPKGAPVWHMHETIDRLKRLCHGYERVCIGSSASFSVVGSDLWHRRMTEAMNAVCGSGPVPVWLHMLRGMSLAGDIYPFASVDSTDIARNHHLPHQNAKKMAERWDALQCPARWEIHDQMSLEVVA